jgi:hypothetical protein
MQGGNQHHEGNQWLTTGSNKGALPVNISLEERFGMKLKSRVTRSIAARKSVVVLRSELRDRGSPAYLSRILARLVNDGKLVRVSRGIYAKTRLNKCTGRLAPAATFESIAAEAFRKLRIDIAPGTLTSEYNAGKTSQLPMLAVVNTGRRRITRRIRVGNRTVTYERRSVHQRPSRSRLIGALYG